MPHLDHFQGELSWFGLAGFLDSRWDDYALGFVTIPSLFAMQTGLAFERLYRFLPLSSHDHVKMTDAYESV
jgi:hypothetical protein